MSYLDAIKALKFRVQKVEIEGITFYLRELSGRARMEFDGEKNMEIRVLKMMHSSLCDENGNLTEDPKDFDDFMAATPNKILLTLVNAFSDLNITREEELKNS